MENNDVEIKIYKLLAKIKKEFGNIKSLQSYLKSIQNYYLREYDYNKATFNNDVVNIANDLLTQKSYKKLSKILNIKDLELVVAVTMNELENYCEGLEGR